MLVGIKITSSLLTRTVAVRANKIMHAEDPTRAITFPHVRRADEFLRALIRCCFVIIEVYYFIVGYHWDMCRSTMRST